MCSMFTFAWPITAAIWLIMFGTFLWMTEILCFSAGASSQAGRLTELRMLPVIR